MSDNISLSNLNLFLVTDGKSYLSKSSYVHNDFSNHCLFQSVGPAKAALTKAMGFLKYPQVSEEAKNSEFQKLIAMKIYKISININEGSVDIKQVFAATMSNGFSNLNKG